MRSHSGRFRMAGTVLLMLIVVAVLVGILFKELFVVRSVVVTGVDESKQQEIVRAARVNFGSSIFAQDPDRIRRSLEQTGLYAVDRVIIRKPDTVLLEVRERTRDAVTLNGGSYVVMDCDGYAITSQETLPDGELVYVYGLSAMSYQIGSRLNAQEDRLEAMCAVLRAIRTVGAQGMVSDLNVEDVEHLTLTMRSGLRVELGDAADMDAKILWAKTAAADLESRNQSRGTLDVSSGSKADFVPQ